MAVSTVFHYTSVVQLVICIHFCIILFALTQGRIQDFHGGGGGAKDYVYARTSWVRNPMSQGLTAGIQGPLKGPREALGF